MLKSTHKKSNPPSPIKYVRSTSLIAKKLEPAGLLRCLPQMDTFNKKPEACDA